MLYRLLFTASAVALIAPAHAGDQVLYQDAPSWVVADDLATAERASNSPIVLLDQQARIEDGELWVYVTTAFALDSPQALTQFGTMSAQWMPDKGDLIVHSAELLRGGEVIDLLAGGAEFEVLRRERGLESRLLDGALTATMNVPGARIGDIVRLSYSTTLNDQAMGENVQWQSPLLAKPFPLEDGRISISWPEDLTVSRVRLGEADVAEPVLKDGFYTWSADLPLEEADELPGDAPFRYQMGELMQVTTYSDWRDVSQQMAQHYDTSGAIEPGGDLAKVVADIAAQSDDPLTRAALTLQIVQDDISYLLNGLDGGNYLPQAPEETWGNRYGDCKAKSVLLLAMLRELGVDAEVVLVASQGGDAVPILAPMPGNFDHMIVRAEIEGTNYWLDGTTSNTRLDTIDTVPRFHFALPLRTTGAELMPLDVRPLSIPGQTVRLTIDQTAGVSVPSLVDVSIEFRGAAGAQWRSIADQSDGELRENAIKNSIMGVVGEAQLVDETLTYDLDSGLATISARGIKSSQWRRDRARFEYVPPAQSAKDVGFEADRARAAWRDIPLRLNGPVYFASEIEVLLPQDGEGFEVDGENTLSDTIGGVEMTSDAKLEKGKFTLSQRMRSVDEQLAADKISQARRNLARFDRALPVLRSPTNVRELWEYFGKDRALLEPLEAVYAKAVEEAEPDDPVPLINRAGFRSGTFDYEGALKDVEAAHAIEASQSMYVFRASLKREMGDLAGALEDYQEAEELKPDGSTYWEQVELLSLLGDTEEAIAMAEDYGSFVDNEVTETDLVANALGWAGSAQDGLAKLEELKSRRPGDGSLLNSICWFAGIWDQMNDARLQTCVEAVEKSDYSASALDSRAMANFRMGNLAEAKADTDAALLAAPGQAASRLLRGIIRVAQGDKEGREEITQALAMRPSMRATYEAWGLKF